MTTLMTRERCWLPYPNHDIMMLVATTPLMHPRSFSAFLKPQKLHTDDTSRGALLPFGTRVGEEQHRKQYLECLHDNACDRDVEVLFGSDDHGKMRHEEVEGVYGCHMVAHQDGSHLTLGWLPFDLSTWNHKKSSRGKRHVCAQQAPGPPSSCFAPFVFGAQGMKRMHQCSAEEQTLIQLYPQAKSTVRTHRLTGHKRFLRHFGKGLRQWKRDEKQHGTERNSSQAVS